MSLRDVFEREPRADSIQEWQQKQDEVERRSWWLLLEPSDEWLAEPACACEAIDVDRVVAAFCPVHSKASGMEAPRYVSKEADSDITW